MKLYTNRKYSTVAFYAAIVIALNVLLVIALFNISSIMDIVSNVLSVLNPVIWGLVIAFLMNPIMIRIEKLCRRIFSKSKKEGSGKLLRAISVTLSSIVFLGIVVGLVAVVVPELINSVIDIFNNASTIVGNVQGWINKMFRNYPAIESAATDLLKDFNTNVGTIIEKIQPMLENILSGAWSVVSFVKNFLLGFIVSVYMLCSKEKLMAQIKKIIIATTSKKSCSRIMRVCTEANKIFSGFISGKIIDSIIIGMICFIGLTIANTPYNIMISVLVGVTNIIPFFGPFIGAIPSAILILLIDPKKVVFFLIFILLLQQFDGNVLGPKILGDSTGLPGFWVLISLFVFGGLFGFMGMVLAVPASALVYNFIKEFTVSKLKKKHLPVDTNYYMKDVGHLYKRSIQKAPLTPEQLKLMEIPPAELVNEANESTWQSVNENDDDQ